MRVSVTHFNLRAALARKAVSFAARNLQIAKSSNILGRILVLSRSTVVRASLQIVLVPYRYLLYLYGTHLYASRPTIQGYCKSRLPVPVLVYTVLVLQVVRTGSRIRGIYLSTNYTCTSTHQYVRSILSTVHVRADKRDCR